ncbi:hypothetical protein VTH06DRAFT_2763, partial [Thermothelomyces fergusii]
RARARLPRPGLQPRGAGGALPQLQRRARGLRKGICGHPRVRRRAGPPVLALPHGAGARRLLVDASRSLPGALHGRQGQDRRAHCLAPGPVRRRRCHHRARVQPDGPGAGPAPGGDRPAPDGRPGAVWRPCAGGTHGRGAKGKHAGHARADPRAVRVHRKVRGRPPRPVAGQRRADPAEPGRRPRRGRGAARWREDRRRDGGGRTPSL